MLVERPTGIHLDVSHGEYHRRVLGVASNSALAQVERSPAHYVAWVNGEANDEETEALAFGTAFHMALLEAERFARVYTVAPDFGDCRFKENKAKREEWRAANAGKAELDLGTSTAIEKMVRAVHAHPLASKLLEGGQSEVTATWTDDETGVRCKVRADRYKAANRLIVDVKTARDASPKGFKKAVFNHGYHRQNALYRAGFAAAGAPVEHYILLAVEKTAPFAIGIYQLDAQAIAIGHTRVRDGLALLAECLREDRWPAYSDRIETIEPPPWAA